jgi:F-type H+-transporting ATPase subunit delta
MLIEKICNIFNVTDVEIIENIDESILGGFIIRVGDTIIDSSTKNKLNELEKHLLKSTLVN